jgi:hypothetical protein
MTLRMLTLLAVFAGVTTMTGCTRQQLGSPQVPAAAASPDGRWRAYVRNHATIDPPEQSLWLHDRQSDRHVLVRHLASDADWSSTISWAPDSAAVLFLIQDGRALTVRPADTRVLADRWLFAHEGSYPPKRVVRDVSLAAGGRAVSFVSCERRNDRQVAQARTPATHQNDWALSECAEDTVALSITSAAHGAP